MSTRVMTLVTHDDRFTGAHIRCSGMRVEDLEDLWKNDKLACSGCRQPIQKTLPFLTTAQYLYASKDLLLHFLCTRCAQYFQDAIQKMKNAAPQEHPQEVPQNA